MRWERGGQGKKRRLAEGPEHWWGITDLVLWAAGSHGRYEGGNGTITCTVSCWNLLGLSRWGRPFASILKSPKLFMVACCYLQDCRVGHKDTTWLWPRRPSSTAFDCLVPVSPSKTTFPLGQARSLLPEPENLTAHTALSHSGPRNTAQRLSCAVFQVLGR